MLKLFLAEVSGLSEDYSFLPLSDYRLSRLEKIRISKKRKQAIAAELLLIRAMSEVMPEYKPPFKLKCGEYGKPEFEDVPVYFSLSHSGNYSACAISDSPVGLDVEDEVSFKPKVVERFFTYDEQKMLALAEDKDREFARIWTAKESVLKFLGTGLSRGLSTVHVEDGCSAVLVPENIRLRLFPFERDTLSMCVCTQNKDENPRLEYVNFN